MQYYLAFIVNYSFAFWLGTFAASIKTGSLAMTFASLCIILLGWWAKVELEDVQKMNQYEDR